MKRIFSIILAGIIMAMAAPLALLIIIWAMSTQIADDVTGYLEKTVRQEEKEEF